MPSACTSLPDVRNLPPLCLTGWRKGMSVDIKIIIISKCHSLTVPLACTVIAWGNLWMMCDPFHWANCYGLWLFFLNSVSSLLNSVYVFLLFVLWEMAVAIEWMLGRCMKRLFIITLIMHCDQGEMLIMSASMMFIPPFSKCLYNVRLNRRKAEVQGFL